MEINPNAPLVAQHEIAIAAPRPIVWRLLTDIAGWPRWQGAISQAALEGPLRPENQFRWTSGGMAIVSTIQLVEPERRLGWIGRALGTTTEHIWTLEERGAETLVTTAESMSGWLIYPVKLITPSFLDNALRTWLAALKQAAEADQAGAAFPPRAPQHEYV
jgi:uncharacterized protein YndB with AHSA1/START domain